MNKSADEYIFFLFSVQGQQNVCVSPRGAAVYTPEARQQIEDYRVPTCWVNEPRDTREQGEMTTKNKGGVRRK